MNSGRIWLVTGGAGFIGSHIVEELLRRGKRVRIMDNFSTGKESHIQGILDSVELFRGDVTSLESCRRAARDVEVVFHQAAIRSVPKSVDQPTLSHDANATGTLHMLVAAREAGVRRFVYASSSSVYGDGKRFPQREEFRPRPVSPYAASKLCGEHYAMLFAGTYGLETVSLRYFNVFGPRQDPESMYSAVIPKFMEQAHLGLPLEVHWDGRQSRDFTHVRNVVAANWLAATARKGIGETFNIANGKAYSLLQMIRALERIAGRRFERRHHPKRSGDVRRTWADVSKARRLLGYRPSVGLEEGLRDTWEYFVNGYLKRAPAPAVPAA